MYRVSGQEVFKQQEYYKKHYKPFRAFNFTSIKDKIADQLTSLLMTQDGQDTDDYLVDDNNKVERYLKEIPKGSKVLILGTGTGRELLVAQDMGLDAWGISLGSRNIEYGIEYLGLSKDRLLESTIEVLPFQKGFFDVVAGFQVFEHAIAPLVFLLECNRVTKENGLLVLEWPPACEAFAMGENPHHQICYTPGQAKALLQKASYKDVELFYEDLVTIPVEEYWHGEQQKMLLIRGKKIPSEQEYIKRVTL